MSVECPVPDGFDEDEVEQKAHDKAAGGAMGRRLGVLNGEARSKSLSVRGSRALVPFSPYIRAVNKAKETPWTPETPDGHFLVRGFTGTLAGADGHFLVRGFGSCNLESTLS